MQLLEKIQNDLYPETLLVMFKNGKLITTSLQIGEHCHRAHKNVLREIERVKVEREKAGLPRLSFEPRKMLYKTGKRQAQTREIEYFDLDKKACHILLMGWRGKFAAIFREDFWNAFEAMEAFIRAEANRHASAFAQLKPKLLQIEAGDQQGHSRAQIAQVTGHTCLGSITAGRKRARALGLAVKPAKTGSKS